MATNATRVFFSDGSGGDRSDDPRLRRCGWGFVEVKKAQAGIELLGGKYGTLAIKGGGARPRNADLAVLRESWSETGGDREGSFRRRAPTNDSGTLSARGVVSFSSSLMQEEQADAPTASSVLLRKCRI